MKTKVWESTTFRWRCPEGTVYVHVGEPQEGAKGVYVGAHVGTRGSALNAAAEAMAVLVARCLRSGIPPEVLYLDLCGISSELYRDGGEYEARSTADAIARTLAEVYGHTFKRVKRSISTKV